MTNANLLSSLQAADEEERVHLQTLLSQSQASEAEAVRRASEAAQRHSAAAVQQSGHAQTQIELQEVRYPCSSNMLVVQVLHLGINA